MKMRFVKSLVAFLLLASIALTNSGLRAQWELIPSPVQENMYGFFLAGGEIVSTSSRIGACHSTDEGTTWIAYPGLPKQDGLGSVGIAKSGNILLNSVSDFLLQLPDSSGLYRSADNGTTWHLEADPGLNLSAFTDFGGYFFAGVKGNGVWRSTDSGVTWKHPTDSTRDGGLDRQSILSFYSLGKTLFAVTQNAGVFASTNAGADWFIFNSGLPSLSILAATAEGSYQFIVVRDTGGFGYLIYRNGLTDTNWSPVFHDSARGPSYVNLTSYHNYVFMVGQQQEVYGSSDYGITWKRLSDFPKKFITPVLLVATEHYLLASTDDLYRRPLSDLRVASPKKMPEEASLTLTIASHSIAARFHLDRPQTGLALSIYDMLGRRVGSRSLGFRTVGWNVGDYATGDLPSGFYNCLISADGFCESRTFSIVR